MARAQRRLENPDFQHSPEREKLLEHKATLTNIVERMLNPVELLNISADDIKDYIENLEAMGQDIERLKNTTVVKAWFSSTFSDPKDISASMDAFYPKIKEANRALSTAYQMRKTFDANPKDPEVQAKAWDQMLLFLGTAQQCLKKAKGYFLVRVT
jgi:hypothetical protein